MLYSQTLIKLIIECKNNPPNRGEVIQFLQKLENLHELQNETKKRTIIPIVPRDLILFLEEYPNILECIKGRNKQKDVEVLMYEIELLLFSQAQMELYDYTSISKIFLRFDALMEYISIMEIQLYPIPEKSLLFDTEQQKTIIQKALKAFLNFKEKNTSVRDEWIYRKAISLIKKYC